MLTGVTDGIFCCLLGAPPNAVGPLESVESSDGYTFVEVKPGRVLRVKHAGPAPAPTPPPPLSDAAQGGEYLQSYFLFWNDNVRLLTLLFKNGLGGLFQEQNRDYFLKTPALTGALGHPGRDEAFLRAGIAGITYELLWEWIVNGRGITVEELTALAECLTRGSLVTNS